MQNLLINKVKILGSLPFDEFMNLALLDNNFGYYKVQNPIGQQGDFITSPEISQVFGEIIGSYIAYIWKLIGSPTTFNLIELGGGKGTLLDDILRSTKHINSFHKCLNINILEVNLNLLKIQKRLTTKYETNIKWLNKLNEYSGVGPCFIISNEFFDALPVKQYKKINKQVQELCITVENSNSCDILVPYYMATKNFKAINTVDIYEYSPKSLDLFDQLLDIIKINTGCILTIDYGYIDRKNKNTIRGFYNHQILDLDGILKYSPLCDITYDINFLDFEKQVRNKNLQTYNLLTQRDFLISCGILERTEILVNNCNNDQDKFLISTGTDKLINPNIMGNIFKIMACSSLNIELPIFTKK